jgi:hypothetical protein
VEQFEQIRRDRDREDLSIHELARRHGVHRRAVRQALESAVPPVKRTPVGRPAPKLGPFRVVIDGWLETDRTAPRKQRHTAKRIHQRLVDELGADVAETTVRQYVRGRKRAIGLAVGEVCVPQVHAPGIEAEVDWGQADVVLAAMLLNKVPALFAIPAGVGDMLVAVMTPIAARRIKEGNYGRSLVRFSALGIADLVSALGSEL